MTSLCPAGSDRLRRLFALARYAPTDLSRLFTHRMPRPRTAEAHELFAARRHGVIKIPPAAG